MVTVLKPETLKNDVFKRFKLILNNLGILIFDSKFLIIEDDPGVWASEAGTLPIDDSKVIAKWRLQPGKMLLIDLMAGKIISDEEIKNQLCSANPYK